jgi:hypothetical protein
VKKGKAAAERATALEGDIAKEGSPQNPNLKSRKK